MKIKYRKKFLFELAKIPSPERKEIERFVFEEFPANPSPAYWKNFISLKQDSSQFKIPFHEYRMGLKRTDQNLIFERIRHKNELYRLQS